MSKAFVGIDVAKEHSTVQGIDSDEKKLFYLRFSMDSAGFAGLRSAIKGCGVNLEDIAVAMESTGCYHINSFPSYVGGTSLCGSKSTSNIQICSGVIEKTKTDKKDAMTIAQFLLNNEKKLCVVTSSQDAQDLRIWPGKEGLNLG